MAVVWQKKSGDNHYEIRSAGRTLRLYTNNVCHSQYNPSHLLTGSIWDLLFLPALFLNDQKPLKVLVLGVAGGAVIRQLLQLCAVEKVIGIELDEMHHYVAERFFELDDERIELILADARTWIEECNDLKFDLIIDDVFVEQNRQPVRAIAANSRWLTSLTRMLTDRGILVMNYASRAEMRRSAIFQDQKVSRFFNSIFQITMPTLENHVVSLSRKERKANELHDAIISESRLERAYRSKKLVYRVRNLRTR